MSVHIRRLATRPIHVPPRLPPAPYLQRNQPRAYCQYTARVPLASVAVRLVHGVYPAVFCSELFSDGREACVGRRASIRDAGRGEVLGAWDVRVCETVGGSTRKGDRKGTGSQDG